MALLISRRRHQTSIYNLDPDDFATLFTVVLKRLGLAYSWEQPDRVVLGEPEAAATVEVESFPAMRHVTLHWSGVFDRWRAAVEEELALALKRTPAANGPVSYWFLAGSLLLFVLAITLLARLILSFLHSAW
jgi:hypothetical protein